MSKPSRKSQELTIEEIEALPNPLDMTDEQFLAGARESARHYEETGLHLTHQEVKDWMKRRARGERVPAPKLHT